MDKERNSVSRVGDGGNWERGKWEVSLPRISNQRRNCGFWSWLWLVGWLFLAGTPPAYSLVCSPRERVSYSNKIA